MTTKKSNTSSSSSLIPKEGRLVNLNLEMKLSSLINGTTRLLANLDDDLSMTLNETKTKINDVLDFENDSNASFLNLGAGDSLEANLTNLTNDERSNQRENQAFQIAYSLKLLGYISVFEFILLIFCF